MKNLVSAVVALMCALAIAQQSASAGVEGDVELIRLVAEGNQANIEMIKTWRMQGLERCEDNMHPPGRQLESTAELYFVSDAGQGAKRWKYLPLAYRATSEDGVVTESEPDSDDQGANNGMMKGQALYMYLNYMPKSVTGARPVNIYETNGAPFTNIGNDCDGFSYFGKGHANGSVYGHLMSYVRRQDAPKLHVKVSRSGNIISIETGNEKSTSITRYDASCGYNVVERSSDTVTGERRTLWHHELEWEDVDGVYVPTKVEYKNEVFNVDGSGHHGVRKVTITITSNEVNMPVDPAEFTLEALGVKPGDVVRDHRRGAAFAPPGSDIDRDDLVYETPVDQSGDADEDGLRPVAEPPAGKWAF